MWLALHLILYRFMLDEPSKNNLALMRVNQSLNFLNIIIFDLVPRQFTYLKVKIISQQKSPRLIFMISETL